VLFAENEVKLASNVPTSTLMFSQCILRSFLIIVDDKERQELNGDLIII
jgi:hypothetical protein